MFKIIYWISPRVKDFHWAWNVIFTSAVPSQATCAMPGLWSTVQPAGSHAALCHLFTGFIRMLLVPSAILLLIVSIFQIYLNIQSVTAVLSYDKRTKRESCLTNIYNRPQLGMCVLFSFLTQLHTQTKSVPTMSPSSSLFSLTLTTESHSERDLTSNAPEQH